MLGHSLKARFGPSRAPRASVASRAQAPESQKSLLDVKDVRNQPQRGVPKQFSCPGLTLVEMPQPQHLGILLFIGQEVISPVIIFRLDSSVFQDTALRLDLARPEHGEPVYQAKLRPQSPKNLYWM